MEQRLKKSFKCLCKVNISIDLQNKLIKILDEASESYWKLMTERRKHAIEETVVENQQVRSNSMVFILFIFF